MIPWQGNSARLAWLPWAFALACFGVGLLIGLDVLHCLLLSAACLAVGALPPAGSAGIRSPWPALPYGRRDGARRDVSTLTWTLMNREGQFSSKGTLRVRAVLLEALRLRGIDPATTSGAARTAQLLGEDVAQWLAPPDQAQPHQAPPDQSPPDPDRLAEALTALGLTAPDPTKKGTP